MLAAFNFAYVFGKKPVSRDLRWRVDDKWLSEREDEVACKQKSKRHVHEAGHDDADHIKGNSNEKAGTYTFEIEDVVGGDVHYGEEQETHDGDHVYEFV